MTVTSRGADPGNRESGVDLQLRVRLELPALTLDLELDTRIGSLALVGPSGAGKTTVLRILAGLEPRAKGSVRFGNEVWQSPDGEFLDPWLRGVGWVPQDDLLFPHLTVAQNLAFAARSPADVGKVARVLGVDSLLGRRPRKLSGGERQRVALGRALLSNPRLLLLDEPFAAMDRDLRGEVQDYVRSWARERGVPIVLVTHDDADVRSIARERWELRGGRLTPLRETPGEAGTGRSPSA